jgi:hypothetical protein
VEKLKATATHSGDSPFAEANRALDFQAKLLHLQLIEEIDEALESGGFAWPAEGDG